MEFIYLLVHPLSRSSFLPPYGLFCFGETDYLNSSHLFQLLPKVVANPRIHSLRILSFWCEFLLTVWKVTFSRRVCLWSRHRRHREKRRGPTKRRCPSTRLFVPPRNRHSRSRTINVPVGVGMDFECWWQKRRGLCLSIPQITDHLKGTVNWLAKEQLDMSRLPKVNPSLSLKRRYRVRATHLDGSVNYHGWSSLKFCGRGGSLQRDGDGLARNKSRD